MAIFYVDRDASGLDNGTSWENAYTDLQDALAAAAPNDEIWVAEGTYKPTTGTNRNASFNIPSAVGIYGGFAGGETNREQRDWFNNITILSGDIGQEGVQSDNSLTVVTISNSTPSTIFDGFTISDGNNNAGGIRDGGGISILSGNATLRNLVIEDNIASNSGGGIDVFIASPTLINVTFINNFASVEGGALLIKPGASVVTIENALFVGNEAQRGGAISLSTGNITDTTIANATFYNNQANRGSAIFYYESNRQQTHLVENSIVWNNSGSESQIERRNDGGATVIAVNNSIVEGGYTGPGTEIIESDPLFANPANNDFRLQLGSPGLDAGDNAVISATTDIVDNPRIFNNRVDLGPYEYNSIQVYLEEHLHLTY